MTGEAHDPLLGTVLAGRYRLVRKLGEGGMGAVYAADHAAGGQFAVKVIHAAVAGKMAQARFLQEVRSSASVKSHNVVPLLDSGTDPGLDAPFLVMPLLRGSNVQQVIEEVGPLDPTAAVRIAIQAARGLGTAHAAGVVHRDVKPANLFLDAAPSGEITVKVCDFGVAKVTDPHQDHRLTETGSMLGSPLYMSPEQAKNAKNVDARSDVWSLGVTLYYMLTGTAPHVGATSVAELIISISTKDAEPLLDAAPWVDPALAAIVHGALVRDIDRRCSSMHALFNALLPHAAGGEQLTRAMLVGPSDELRRRVASLSSGAKAGEPTPSEIPEEERLLGSTLGGRYQLSSLLGKGGMGAVFDARDTAGQRFAVKVMFGAMNAPLEARKRFVREARASAAIQSPHVVRVVDADTDPSKGVPFIVMEYLSGKDLHALVGEVGALDPTLGVRLFLQACRGLSAAHARGVVHRDVKPANLFLDTAPSGEITVKVCDFGIAKTTSTEAIDHTSAQLTKTGGILGSPIYMSPEQAKNAKHVDARSDVWSLCMTMYEAFSGKNPWHRCTTIGELILAICTENVPPLADAAPWLDERVAEIVQRGLRREVGERWANLAEIIAALEPLAGGSERITRDMLGGLAPDRRSIPAPRTAPRPSLHSVPPLPNRPSFPSGSGMDSWSQGQLPNAAIASTSAGGATAVTIAGHPRRSPVGVVILGAAAVLVLGSVATWRLLATKSPETTAIATTATPIPEAATASAAPTPAPTAPAKISARIAIHPAGATVTVDGHARDLDDDHLILEGAPGDSFKIVAITKTGRLEETVKLQSDGKAEPATLTVPARTGPVKPAGPARPRIKTDWK